MKLCMVGGGYVGLVSGACFAETGTQVICADIDKSKIEQLRAGEVPIFEPGLGPMIERNVDAGRLTFSDDVPAAVAEALVSFIAVGTPRRSDGAADLRAVDAVAETVAKHCQHESVLVLKSTVPVGTNERVRRIVADAPHPIHVVSNPEFLKEGDAINDFLRPDRIVIGCDKDDAFATDLMARLYHPVSLSRERIIWMDPASAELTKYVSNTMLAMRISFMNEIAGLCEKVGADVHQVRQGVGSDLRIGPKFLYAGPGYGGSCFPKDVAALVQTAREHEIELELAAATDRVNSRQKGVLARKLKGHFDGDLRGKRVAVWGIAFKPRTDDIRESAALQLIDVLLAEGAQVAAHDPEAMGTARANYGDRIELFDDAYDAARDADALVLVTEWRQYQNPDFKRLRELLRRPLLLDGRNIWSGYGLRSMGFTYDGIGVRGS
ncbi:MAG: UDP-glucose/GDP-mannose dehydrogenase family protein [Deltaproteobacteria bacterium]|jgi:UDPglucose 6-dehydrogenase|nr:UDP-glucose/GDP-mannose dehydrogenase family protein [Deltaproteobacteria bacterium]MBW2530173.1 UDP-glucose/GDP-mannose dehydrogenase family protein [Deltaproteobacteria bacterium]